MQRRVRADTNFMISYLLAPDVQAGAKRAFVEAAVAGELTLLLPAELLDEL